MGLRKKWADSGGNLQTLKCGCGCGQHTRFRYVRGHNSKVNPPMKGRRQSIFQRERVSEVMMGRAVSMETRKRVSESQTPEILQKKSLLMRQYNETHPPTKGQLGHRTIEYKEKIALRRFQHDMIQLQRIKYLESLGATIFFTDFARRRGTIPDIIYRLGDQVLSEDVKWNGQIQVEGKWDL